MITLPRETASQASLEGLAPQLRVLGARERLRIMVLLAGQEQQARELGELLGVSRPALYRHLRALQRAGLVRARRAEGSRVAYYHCDGSRLAELTSSYLTLLGRGVVAGAASQRQVGGPALALLGPPPGECTYCQNSYYVYGVLQGMNRTLAEARETQAQLRRMSSQVLSAQEEERKRIARDLHDDTAQALTSLLVRLRLLERLEDPAEVKASLSQLRQLATETLDGVRRLALNLRPSTLDDLGLAPAVRWYVSDFTQRWGIAVDFEAVGLEQRLPAQVELVLYRIAQEALTNVAKHANARRVKVMLERRSEKVRLVVEDDGRGFDVEPTMRSKERGLGLFGMEERLALLGGGVAIQSQPGRGTRVEASLSLVG